VKAGENRLSDRRSLSPAFDWLARISTILKLFYRSNNIRVTRLCMCLNIVDQ
jgi:hypothetical protein